MTRWREPAGRLETSHPSRPPIPRLPLLRDDVNFPLEKGSAFWRLPTNARRPVRSTHCYARKAFIPLTWQTGATSALRLLVMHCDQKNSGANVNWRWLKHGGLIYAHV